MLIFIHLSSSYYNPYYYPNFQPRSEVSLFNGDGVDQWLHQIECFFIRYQTFPDQKLAVADRYLTGEALEWYQQWHREMWWRWFQLPKWDEFVRDLKSRFKPPEIQTSIHEVIDSDWFSVKLQELKQFMRETKSQSSVFNSKPDVVVVESTPESVESAAVEVTDIFEDVESEMTTENILELEVDEAADSGDDSYDLDVHLHLDPKISVVIDFTLQEVTLNRLPVVNQTVSVTKTDQYDDLNEELRSETSLGDLISSFNFRTSTVCGNASMDWSSYFVTNSVCIKSWCSHPPLEHTSIDYKSVLVLKVDEIVLKSKELKPGIVVSMSLNFCTETVRLNVCEIFPFFLPPAKPPDECLSLLQVYSNWCCTKCCNLALSSIQEKELLVWIATRTCASIFMMEYEALLSCYHMLCLFAGATKFRWPKMEAKKKIEIEYTEVFDKQIIMHLPILLCEQIYKKRKIFVPLDLAHMNRQYPIRKEFLLLELDKVLENYNNFSIQRNVDNDNGNVLDEAENLFGQVIGGPDKLVMNMKKGEVTLVTIAPENDFGYVESQHDMIAVISNSVLFYEDELESFDKKQTSFDMNLKETIQVAGQADVIALKEKGVRLANEMIRESMMVEHDTISNSGYAVSGVLSSSNLGFTSRSECLLELLEGEVQYVVYKLDLRSCAFTDINGGTHEQGFDINGFEQGYRNKVIGTVCRDRLVDEAKFIVFKLVDFIKPEVITYRFLIEGFCNAGDLIEACKLFNLMADQGIGIDVCSVEKLMETMHKQNQFSEAFKLFQAMSVKYSGNLGLSTCKILIHWLCKRGIKADNATSRISEVYGVLEGIEKPEISIYHGLIKGLLRLKKPSETIQVFRAMIRQGCEPTMHTYIMLLQGHMGKRGRKGDDPLVNFDTILVGGLVNAGKSLEATKYVERVMDRGLEVPKFDYNKCLHYYSNDEGVLMFEELSPAAHLSNLISFFEAFGMNLNGTASLITVIAAAKLKYTHRFCQRSKEADFALLVRHVNSIFMFSLPRPPEIATLRTRLILREMECYVLKYCHIRKLED